MSWQLQICNNTSNGWIMTNTVMHLIKKICQKQLFNAIIMNTISESKWNFIIKIDIRSRIEKKTKIDAEVFD